MVVNIQVSLNIGYFVISRETASFCGVELIVGWLAGEPVYFASVTKLLSSLTVLACQMMTYYYYYYYYYITAIEFSLGGCSPYSSTDATNKNKCT